MTYYLLPKNINDININPKMSSIKLNTYISHSLFNYYNKSIIDLKNIYKQYKNYMSIDDIIKIINPYEYIYSKVPETNYSVSKLKIKNNIFYNIFEIFSSINLLDNYNNKNINSIIISKNHSDINYYLKLVREKYNDITISHENIDRFNILDENDKYDFIFYEKEVENNCILLEKNDIFNNTKDIINLIKLIIFVIKNQDKNGFLVLKIDTLFDKSIVDIIYILSFLYDKLFIIKPNTSNIISFDKYIICKNYLYSNKENIKNNSFVYNNLYPKIINFVSLLDSLMKNIIELNILQSFNIEYILKEDIPSHFLNRLDEINIILGQQQLEYIDNIINIIKNKNKDEKIESIKKMNIQKCIIWCEKYKIPYNKFIDKTNIFLNNKNDTIK